MEGRKCSQLVPSSVPSSPDFFHATLKFHRLEREESIRSHIILQIPPPSPKTNFHAPGDGSVPRRARLRPHPAARFNSEPATPVKNEAKPPPLRPSSAPDHQNGGVKKAKAKLNNKSAARARLEAQLAVAVAEETAARQELRDAARKEEVEPARKALAAAKYRLNDKKIELDDAGAKILATTLALEHAEQREEDLV